MKNEKHLPALNDIELRKLNTKKIIDTVEEVGSLVKVVKRDKKISIVTGIIILFILLFLVLGSYLYVFIKTDGSFFDNIFNLDSVSKRYVCWNEEYNTTFRDSKNALEFKELFNNINCTFYSVEK